MTGHGSAAPSAIALATRAALLPKDLLAMLLADALATLEGVCVT